MRQRITSLKLNIKEQTSYIDLHTMAGAPWDYHRYTWQALVRYVLEAGLCVEDLRVFGSSLEVMLARLGLPPMGAGKLTR